MARLVPLSGVALCLLTGAAVAGQSTARFNVGITITGARTGQPAPAPARAKTWTWRAAAISVKRAGFENLRRVSVSDAYYWFEAERGGGTWRIAVSIASGAIAKVDPA